MFDDIIDEMLSEEVESVEEAEVVEEESNGLADFQAEDDNDSVPF